MSLGPGIPAALCAPAPENDLGHRFLRAMRFDALPFPAASTMSTGSIESRREGI